MREERRPEGARWTLGQTWPKALYGCRRRGHTLRRRERPANRHHSPLLVPTLKAVSEALGTLPEQASVHLETAATTRSSPASAWRSWGLGSRSRARTDRPLIGQRSGGL